MAPEKRNRRAGDAAARDRLARQLDGPNPTATRRALQPTPSAAYVDELLVRLSDRLRRPGLTGFEAGFCRSVLGQAKRGGPRWRPSERQRAVAERILAEHDVPDGPLIEELDP